ncbi:MAG TPA: hypothetical protein VG817_08510, partial [Gemmatimonadales bacterium]|nr:hypothetical protein [Gemmatimonadales bacterium]
EVALERLAPYLPSRVNPLDGLPVALFFPDAAERRALFSHPEKLPHKRQVRFGPETVSILVSPVRDGDQKFLGPQITWEIVHFTRPDDVAAPPPPPATPLTVERDPEAEALAQLLELSPSAPSAVAGRAPHFEEAVFAQLPEVVAAPAPPPAAPRPSVAATMEFLRGNARVLEQAGQRMQQLAALLDSVAQLSTQDFDDTGATAPVDRSDAESITRGVEAAQEALSLARQCGTGARGEVDQALQWLERLAREANLLAVQAAADVLREDAVTAGNTLREAVEGLSEGMAERVEQVTAIAQNAAQTLHAAGVRTSRVRALRAVLRDLPSETEPG